ncbi:TPA: hypothetical protein ACQVKY_005329, partial [Serratia marcescens]
LHFRPIFNQIKDFGLVPSYEPKPEAQLSINCHGYFLNTTFSFLEAEKRFIEKLVTLFNF